MTDQTDQTAVTSLTCPWYVRWLHRRRRALDERFMIPAILRAASHALTQDQGLQPSRRVRAFYRFVHERGQEHWLCACASADRIRVMESLEQP
jgi:hypothetical protein